MYTFEYPDEVIKELWKIREEHAERFNYNLEAMAMDLKKEQDASGKKVVSFMVRKQKQTENEPPLAKAS